MTRLLPVLLLIPILSACAATPQPYCAPWELRRAPEADTGFGPVPRAAAQTEIANPCEFAKEEAEARQERKPEAAADPE